MFGFLLASLRHHLWRSIGMITTMICIMTLSLLTLSLYQNGKKLISYYTYPSQDEYRFQISANTGFFDMFGSGAGRLPGDLITRLLGDPRISSVQTYTLVEIPVTAHIGFFAFGLDTDVPIFAVNDGVLTGATVPLGLSQKMIDFYNTQFAGSSTAFPQINEFFLRGKDITLTFGASRIFPSLPRVATPIRGEITRVSMDFPGFGIIVPEGIVRERMQETGYSLGQPYRAILRMRSLSDREGLMRDYSGYRIVFDMDEMRTLSDRIRVFGFIIFSSGAFFVGIFALLSGILLVSYFRERRDVYVLVSLLGLRGIRARLGTLGEPLILLSISLGLTILSVWWIWIPLHDRLIALLTRYGIYADLVFVETPLMALVLSVLTSILLTGIGWLDFSHSRK